MKIIHMEVRKFVSYLKKPFKTALRETDKVETFVVFLFTDEGHIGVGEGVPTPMITGDTNESISAAFDKIKTVVAGKTLNEALLESVQKCIVLNTSAKAAVDMALFDLLAQEEEVSLTEYLSRKITNQHTFEKEAPLKTSHTVSLNDSDEMAQDALNYVNEGFNALKVKLGNDVKKDVERIQKIDDVLPEGIILSVDANQGWTREDFNYFKAYIDEHHISIDVIEQPVYRRNILDLSTIARDSNIPVMADESLFDHYDAELLIHLGSVKYFNIKLMKSGGIFEAMKIATLARDNGIQCMVGSMMESHIALSAAMHFAMAINAFKVDFDAPYMLKEKRIAGGITYDGLHISMSDGTGLCIDGQQLWEALKDAESM